mmetsp:Transcript_82088/g.145519  ORF Transcript_82088/g.145519 Transcript_82088/m.145519 type:complete len:157 (+) Transcript_82088:92-562(+)
MLSLLTSLVYLILHANALTVNFDAPRDGPVCCSAVVGDTAVFRWEEQHNLHKLASASAYSGCGFNEAERLTSTGPNDGHSVKLSSAGDHYFACNKICSSNGHKVKICVGDGAKPDCPCPEGRFFDGDACGANRLHGLRASSLVLLAVEGLFRLCFN